MFPSGQIDKQNVTYLYNGVFGHEKGSSDTAWVTYYAEQKKPVMKD